MAAPRPLSPEIVAAVLAYQRELRKMPEVAGKIYNRTLDRLLRDLEVACLDPAPKPARRRGR